MPHPPTPAAPTTGRVARDRWPDSTLALGLQGYGFTARRVRRHRAEVLQLRVALRRTTLLVGADAARVLYDPERFVRAGAMPAVVRRTLLGEGGVQGLDGERHRVRKAMLLSFLGPERARELADATAVAWREALPRWSAEPTVVLLDVAAELLCRVVCDWAGVSLPEAEVPRRTRDLRGLVELAGDPALGYWRARRARRRAESWAAGLVADVRRGVLSPPEGSALASVASYREPDGELLDTRTAAVDLLNVLRPTVALHRWIALAALALHQHPEWRPRLREDEADVVPFVHEVRRFYPFFPMVAARVRRPFTWRGVAFPRGRRVLLDLTATDRDARAWDAPEEFRPERFRGWAGDAYAFVPQGGGDHGEGHRCAGEWISIEVLAAAVRFLAREVDYRVPEQDLRVSTRRMPTAPRSGFVLSEVRPVEAPPP